MCPFSSLSSITHNEYNSNLVILKARCHKRCLCGFSFSRPNTGSGAQARYCGCGLWCHSELQVVWQPPSHAHLDQEGLQHGENKLSPTNLPQPLDLEAFMSYLSSISTTIFHFSGCKMYVRTIGVNFILVNNRPENPKPRPTQTTQTS